MSADPYAHHAIVLAYGATREELAANLRMMADHVERGGEDIVTSGATVAPHPPICFERSTT